MPERVYHILSTFLASLPRTSHPSTPIGWLLRPSRPTRSIRRARKQAGGGRDRSDGAGTEGGESEKDQLPVGSGPLGPVDPSFRALSGRLNFTVRRHKCNKDSLSGQVFAPPSPFFKNV